MYVMLAIVIYIHAFPFSAGELHCSLYIQVSEVRSLDSTSLKLVGDERNDIKEPMLPQQVDRERTDVSIDPTKKVNEPKMAAIAVNAVNSTEMTVGQAAAASMMKSTTLPVKPVGQANSRSGWGRTSVSFLCLHISRF